MDLHAEHEPDLAGLAVDWEIEPVAEGTRIRFRHEAFSAGGPPYDSTVQGWQLSMGSLQRYLDGGEASPSD
jgi:hypothetical protein